MPAGASDSGSTGRPTVAGPGSTTGPTATGTTGTTSTTGTTGVSVTTGATLNGSITAGATSGTSTGSAASTTGSSSSTTSAGSAGTTGTVASSGTTGSTGAVATSGTTGRTTATTATSSTSGSTTATSSTSGTTATSSTSGTTGTTATSSTSGTTGTTATSSTSGTTGTTATSSTSGTTGTTTGTTGGTLHATVVNAPAGGWQVLSGASGAPSRVNDVSADEGGNIWVAGGTEGLFLLRAGSSTFQRFGLADGLHPYGFPTTGTITSVYLNVISVAGGAAGHAYVGYQGVDGCEDEWDQHASNPDPNIYKSGDADHVWLTGSGLGVAHYDIYTGPGIVASEARGREKLCSIYRIGYDGAHGNVWIGANHGYAWLNPNYNGSPAYSGNDSPSMLQEHAHPAISGYLHDTSPSTNEVLLTGGYYGLSLAPNGDLWIGGIFRTYHCQGGNGGSNFWGCEGDDNAIYHHQIDIWPDALSADAYPRQRTDDYVTGLGIMPDGSLWASARNRADDGSVGPGLGLGLAHLNADGSVSGYLTEGFTNIHLTALAADPDGTVWVGSESGLQRYNPSTGVMFHYGADTVGGFAGDAVTNIQIDRNRSPRRVLVGFASGAVGIYTGN